MYIKEGRSLVKPTAKFPDQQFYAATWLAGKYKQGVASTSDSNSAVRQITWVVVWHVVF